jgi:phage tail-like protein
LPAGLAQECDRWKPEEPCLGTSPDALVFNIQGQRLPVIDPLDTLGPRPYLKDGAWISEPLDSEKYACQWHRIVAELSELPPGNRVIFSTYSNEELRATEDILNLPEEMWDTKATVSGEMQPPAEIEEAEGDLPADFLVQSRKGRYLWLKLAFQGDGYESPAIQSLRVHYPRSSYLEYLPAVFAADDESRWFLERFLSIVQSDWDGLEEEIEHISRYFDPRAVPAGEALEYLASWLALPLEGDWSQEQKRNLLAAAPGIYPKRGTAESLRRYLQIYLQNMTGLEPEGQRGYPRLVEGFRERRFAMLATDETSRLGLGAPLWGPGLVGRLQLDVFATEGEVRMVSTGDPERDVLHEYAHRFRVFLPAAWIRSAEDERMIRRALEAEKPAHTQYDLCLVEPHLRVGLQSTVGLDTIIGDYPVIRLGTPCMDGDPPSRSPRHRLGYDTILGGIAAGSRQTEVGPSTRVGMDTIIG